MVLKRLAAIAGIIVSLALCSCSPAHPASAAATSSADDGPSVIETVIDWTISTVDEILNRAKEGAEHRRTATPGHYALGDEAIATENLAVSVVRVEAGPYDYLDNTATTAVTVRMRNTSDHTVVVKASNWDADTKNGERVDHKYVVMGEGRNIIASSFTVARISPGATYEAVVYFDGELVSVIYEPHWLISAENEYIYFDL